MGKKDFETLLDVFETLERLANYSDNVTITSQEAAIYLRLSIAKLERMRVTGDGPVYIQGGSKGSKGTNHKVTYLLGDLRQWQRDNKVRSSMDAAVRRGMAMASVKDTIWRIPFWCDGERVFGRVLDDTPEEYLRNRNCFEIEWLTVSKALERDWICKDNYVRIAGRYKEILTKELNKLTAIC